MTCRLAFALIVSACGPEPDGPTATFPVRLFPQTYADLSILKLTMDGDEVLDRWQVLKMTGERLALSPAADDPRTRVEDGTLVLDPSLAALVRLFELPPNLRFELTTRLAPVEEVTPGEFCGRFYLVRLEQLADDQSLADWMRSGMVRESGGGLVSIETFLRRRLKARMTNPSGASWTSRVDAAGLAGARCPSRTFEQHEAWALVVLATPTGARIGPVNFTMLPESRMAYRANSHATEDHVVRPTKLLGRTVPAVYLAPGQTLVREAAIPPGATTLSFSLGSDPEASPTSVANWSVEVQTVSGEWHAIGSGSRARGDGGASFSDQDLAWPDGASSNASSSIRFRVDGDAGLFIGQPLVRGPAADGRPNLLIISLDTLRADHLGCYGYDRPTSPFLDAFAESSALFTDVVAVAPYTLPTHATMFTGLMPVRHGVVESRDRLDTQRVAYLPKILAAHGYLTAAFTGGGLVSDEFGFDAGFDSYDMADPISGTFFGRGMPSGGGRPQSYMLDRVTDWIESRADERWFVFVHSYVVHEYRAPKKDFAPFDTHPELPDDRDPMLIPRYKEWFENGTTPGEIEHLMNRYDSAIHFADRAVARLVMRLDRQGLLEDAVIVITSDHGEEFWEHGGYGHGMTLHEELLQIPLIVRVPGGLAGRRIERPISQADLAPTLLDLLDLPPLTEVDGTSRAAWIRGEPATSRTTPLYAHSDTVTSRRVSLRVGSLKIIRGDTSAALVRPAPTAWRLYDLARDPGETTNLAEELPDALARLRSQLEAYERALADRVLAGSTTILSPELLQQLDELGY